MLYSHLGDGFLHQRFQQHLQFFAETTCNSMFNNTIVFDHMATGNNPRHPSIPGEPSKGFHLAPVWLNDTNWGGQVSCMRLMRHRRDVWFDETYCTPRRKCLMIDDLGSGFNDVLMCVSLFLRTGKSCHFTHIIMLSPWPPWVICVLKVW